MHVCAWIAILRLSAAAADATETWAVKAAQSLNDDAKGPVARVVELLVDMEKQLGKDAEDDDEINEQMLCWCKNSKKERTQLVADNTETSGQLREEIESLRAKSQELNTEIQDLSGEMNNEQKKLDEAIGMRKEDLKKFTATESSTMASIKALEGASVALGGAKSSTMQVNLDDESAVYKALKQSLNHRKGKHTILWAIHTKKERKVLEDIISHERDIDLIQSKKRETAISAPGNVIQGAINSLTDTFKENLKSLQADENRDSAAHEAMKKEKKKSIKAQADMLEAKTQQLAAADERAANARVELDDAVEQLTGDTDFLGKLEQQCALHSKEYAARTATRKEELEAISQAKLVLTHDDAKDTFTRSLGHTKRPAEGKLGSRGLAEYKEERETQSLNSQMNAARKASYGSDIRYGEGLLQIKTKNKTSHTEAPKKIAQVSIHKEHGLKLDTDPHLTAAQKLAAIADRTTQLYKAKYYMEEQQKKKAAEEAKRLADLKAKAAKEHPVNETAEAQPEPRNKLGLTASEMKLRAAGMGEVSEGLVKMRQSLEMQQGEESARQEWCKDSIITTEKQLDIEKRRKADQQEQLEQIEMEIRTLQAQVRGLTRAQMDADIELAKAGIDRKKASTGFQKTVNDQELTKKLLNQALGVLQAFYKKKKATASLIRRQMTGTTDFDRTIGSMRAAAGSVLGVDDQFDLGSAVAYENALETTPVRGRMALVQSKGKNATDNKTVQVQSKGRNATDNKTNISKPVAKSMLQDDSDDKYAPPPPPPPGFKKYSKGAASGGLLTMIQSLIDDAHAMVEESVKDETEAMKGYEAYVQAANDQTKKRQEAITNRRLEIGKNEEFKNEENIRLNETIAEVARLRQYDIDLYGVEGCDYLLKNYEVRFIERKEEIDKLKEAEAILGAQGGPAPPAKAEGEEEKKEEPAEQVETEAHAVEGGVELESNAHSGERAVVHMASGGV